MNEKLTAQEIKAAATRKKQYKLSDGNGMFLLVHPNGSKYWRLKYRIAGKEKTLALGVYPGVGLSEARKLCMKARELISQGIDPIAQKREAQTAAEEQERRDALTFEAVGREYYEKKTANLMPRYRKLYLSRLEKNLYPHIGSIPMADLRRTDILPALRELEARGHVETAHRVAIIAGQVCRYARDCGYVEFNVADELGRALSRAKHTPRAAILDPEKIGELLRAIDDYRGDVSVRYALRIMPYVFVRSAELRGARWDEIDFDGGVWCVPAERMKRKREHLVPLAGQVIGLFRELQEDTGDGELCFPSPFSRTRPISDMGLLNGLRRMGYGKGEMDVHGFRSIASTLLNEQGFRSDVIEMQLSHAQKDSTRGAYNRALYLPERMEMMQAWADYLDGLRGA